MLKALNLIKGLSAALFLGILLLVYAFLPVMVQLTPQQNTGLELHREHFFYLAMVLFVLVNLVLGLIQRLTEPRMTKEEVKAWGRGLTFVINLYLTFLIGFIGVINNPAHISPSGYAYLNFLGPTLIIAWIIGLFVLLKKRD